MLEIIIYPFSYRPSSFLIFRPVSMIEMLESAAAAILNFIPIPSSSLRESSNAIENIKTRMINVNPNQAIS
jgi:hypothetical protein